MGRKKRDCYAYAVVNVSLSLAVTVVLGGFADDARRTPAGTVAPYQVEWLRWSGMLVPA